MRPWFVFMLEKFRNFMYGRYGLDKLGVALIVLGCITSFVLSFVRIPFLGLVALVPYGFMLFRVFSKNYEKRKKENDVFIRIWIPWKNFFITKHRQHSDSEHKYYKCPKCSHTLRVPKNRGKIEITCPYCQKKFKKNTGKKPAI